MVDNELGNTDKLLEKKPPRKVGAPMLTRKEKRSLSSKFAGKMAALSKKVKGAKVPSGKIMNSPLRAVVDDLLMKQEVGFLKVSVEGIRRLLIEQHGFNVSRSCLLDYKKRYYSSMDPEVKSRRMSELKVATEKKDGILDHIEELIKSGTATDVDYLTQLLHHLEEIGGILLTEIRTAKTYTSVDRLVDVFDQIRQIKDSLWKRTRGQDLTELYTSITGEVAQIAIEVLYSKIAKEDKEVAKKEFKQRILVYQETKHAEVVERAITSTRKMKEALS
jgi:hypothetical protein